MMNKYQNSFIRYEQQVKSCGHPDCNGYMVPVRVTKEMLDKRLTVTRVTELKSFHVPESHYMTSEQLNGWGSCRYTGKVPTRDTLVKDGFVIPDVALVEHEPCLHLDDWAWKSHKDDVARIKAGLEPQLPAHLMPKIVDESGLTELEE